MSATLLIASWGALTGTAAAGISIANYLGDRPKLRMTASTGFLWSERDDEDEDEDEDEEGRWLSFVELEVVNIGRQPVAVMNVGLRTAPDSGENKWFIYKDDDRFTDTDDFPVVIPAGGAMRITGLRTRDLTFAAVTDARGNEIIVPVPELGEPPSSGSSSSEPSG